MIHSFVGRSMVFSVLVGILLFAGGCKGESAPPVAGGSEDFGKQPWAVDVEKLTVENTNFRAAAWTGTRLQLTVMSIKPGGEIGLEKHDGMDQFLRIERGQGRVMMGKDKDKLDYVKEVSDDWVVLVPGGYWHNLINTGAMDLKVYSIYGPPEHPFGTLHRSFEEAEADHHDH